MPEYGDAVGLASSHARLRNDCVHHGHFAHMHHKC
jgi:hypothetical protein